MENNITIVIIMLGNSPKEYKTEINPNYTYLDLLKYLLNENDAYELSGFTIANIDKITVFNAKNCISLIDLLDRKITLIESSCLTPKNCMHKAGVIVSIHEMGLERTLNLNDICLFNHGKIGEWIGFGSGPLTVENTDNNTIEHLLFITYKNITYVYNIHCLIRTIDMDSNKSLILHLNNIAYANIVLEKISNVFSNKIKAITLEEEDFYKNLP